MDGDVDIRSEVVKVHEELGLVLGWGVICKSDGEEYFDLQDDSVTEDALLKAAVDFVQAGAAANDMHVGADRGRYLFAWPMTSEVAKAFGIDARGKSGLMLGYMPSAEDLAKFKSGERTGFSIEGKVTDAELVGEV